MNDEGLGFNSQLSIFFFFFIIFNEIQMSVTYCKNICNLFFNVFSFPVFVCLLSRDTVSMQC